MSSDFLFCFSLSLFGFGYLFLFFLFFFVLHFFYPFFISSVLAILWVFSELSLSEALVDSEDEILPSSPKEYKGSSLTDEEYNLVHAWIYEQVRKSGVATKKSSVGRPRKFEKSFSANSVCFFLCNHPKIHEKLSIGTVRQWVAEYVAGASLKRSQQRKHKGGACPRSHFLLN